MMRWHLPLIVLLLSPGLTAAQLRTDNFPSRREVAARRDAIQRELDGNQAAAINLFELLDATPPTAAKARASIESQIRQLDDRSNVLFGQLDALDQQQRDRERFTGLELQVQQWGAEAQQLRTAGYTVPAALRTAKARALQRMLRDGTWKRFRAPTPAKTPSQPPPPPSDLANEVHKLRMETRALQAELQELRGLVRDLTQQLRTVSAP